MAVEESNIFISRKRTSTLNLHYIEKLEMYIVLNKRTKVLMFLGENLCDLSQLRHRNHESLKKTR